MVIFNKKMGLAFCKVRFIVVFFFFFFISPYSFSEKTVITFAYSTTESPPYQMGNGDELPPLPGVAIDLINEVSSFLDVTPKFFRFPNNRVLFELQDNKVDAAFIFSLNEDREKYSKYPRKKNNIDIDHEKRITTLTYYFYVKDNKITWDGKNLLESGVPIKNFSRSIGVNSGYSIIAQLKEMNLPIEEARTTEQNFDRLSLDRILGFVNQDNINDEYIRLNPQFSKIKKLEPAISTKDYFVIFNNQFYNKNPELVENFWNRMKEIRDIRLPILIKKYTE